MLRRSGTLALLATAFVGTLALGQGHAPDAPASGDLFPIVPGENRVRVYTCSGHILGKLETSFGAHERLASGDYVVYELRGRVFATSAARTIAREWLRADEHGVLCGQRQEGAVTAVLDPPQRFLDFPLEVGKRWSWKGTANGLPCESTSLVTGRERLVLPIGTIEDAWRIDTVTLGRKGDKLERSIWLAPGLGLVQEVSHAESQGRSFGVAAKLEGTAEIDTHVSTAKARRGH
jgi:hypothetical protein